MSTNVSDWNPWRSPPRASAPKRSRIGRSVRRRLQGARHRRNMPTDASDWNPRFSPAPVSSSETFTNRPGPVRRRRQGARHRRNMPTNVSDRNPRFSPPPCPRPKRSRIGPVRPPAAARRSSSAKHANGRFRLESAILPRPHVLVRNVHESACPSAGGSGPMTSTSSATTATEPSSSSLSSIGENSGLSEASVILTCLQPSSPAVFSLR